MSKSGAFSPQVFVGNVAFDATEVELYKALHDAHVPLTEVKIINDKGTGRSRGFSFVTLEPGADPEVVIGQITFAAIKLRGRTLRANTVHTQSKHEASRPRDQKPANREPRRGRHYVPFDDGF